MLRTAVFPGSFDPLTNGHVDIVERALTIFDKVIVAVVAETRKASLFSVDQRLNMISRKFEAHGSRVEVQTFSGLLVEHVKAVRADVIVRGLRAISDYDYEAQMALMNRHLSGGIETLFMMAREEYSYISSTLVRQIAALNGNVGKLVPDLVEKALREKFAR